MLIVCEENTITRSTDSIQRHMKHTLNKMRQNLFCSKPEYTLLLLVTLIHILLPVCDGCYAFPPGKRNPCEDETCHYGAICVISKDGLSARCQCEETCYDYGDSFGSKPICGSDGKDYKNNCEMKRASCISLTKIVVKYYGKCGKCSHAHSF